MAPINKSNQATHLKREILVRLIKAFMGENFEEKVRLIPFDMRPKGSEVPFRCCIYKERAVIQDRTIAGLGCSIEAADEKILLSDYAKKAMERETPDNEVLTVLETACKACVPSRIYVTDLCQGCVARPCVNSCSFGAISIVDGRSVIDGSKCKSCGKCIAVCPYQAITKIIVPCENACPVTAIEKDENGHARIDFDKCITCGKCVDACPFGAVHEKSQVIDILRHMKESKKVVAMFAPALVGQLPCSALQLHTAIKQIGFDRVYEVAQGADITTKHESSEFIERMERGDEFMTTSCCSAYIQLVKKQLPEIKPFVSETQTPLYYTAELAKQREECVTVFFTPCVAKRKEAMENPNVDYVLSFEELGALFIAMKIEVANCEETPYEFEASKQGRNYALTGGVAKAVETALDGEIEVLKPYVIHGLNKQSIRDLKKYAKNGMCEMGNLIEVMSCEGGCIGGNGCINAVKTAHKKIAEYAENSKDISELK